MITIFILAILFAGLGCGGVGLLGIRSFARSHDWHYAVGSVLYLTACALLVSWVFRMSW